MDKRKLIGSFAAIGAVAMGLMFGGDGGHDVAPGSYRGGYYSQVGSYAGGSAAASYDTFTIVFTMDATADHSIAQHNTDVAAADFVYELGTGQDVPTFAYGIVDSATAIGYDTGNNWHNIVPPPRISGSSPLAHDINIGAYSGLSGLLVYIPVEDYIPANSTIASADWYSVAWGSSGFTLGDSLYSVLMTNPNDSEWYGSKGITSWPNNAHASWQRQVSTRGGDPDWAASNSDPWVPELAARDYYWDWGDYWDISGGTEADPFLLTDVAHHASLRNCVQGAVNGAVNNGFLFVGGEKNTTTQQWRTFGWDEVVTNVNKSPWITIKYITKRYQKPFGTSEWVMAMSTDDGVLAANTQYVSNMKSHGGALTVFFSERHFGVAGYTDMDSLMTWLDRDRMEIGPHSRYHLQTEGLREWQPADTTSALYDSLKFDATPEWFYARADSFDGNQRRSDPYFAKSMALPNNELSPFVLRAVADMGYVQVRVGQAAGGNVTGDFSYRFISNERPAATDSLFAGRAWPNQREPRNMLGLPYTMGVNTIVGELANTTITEADVKHNMRRAINHIRGDGRGVLSLFWHDFKTAPTGAYAEGVDSEEHLWMLEVVDELGGRYMRVSEYGRHIKATATAIATPAAYSQVDTFKFTAEDRVWFLPDGMGNAFIPGVK